MQQIDEFTELEEPKIVTETLVSKKTKRHKKYEDTLESIDQEEIITLRKRVNELEQLHPELQSKKSTSFYFWLFKWLFFLIIVGIFLYSIFLFYLYDQLGKDIVIPFIGIIRN